MPLLTIFFSEAAVIVLPFKSKLTILLFGNVCNLVNEVPPLPQTTYDLVIHAAGKAHVVPRNEAERKM